MALTAPHATVFVDPEVAHEVEAIRGRWDPVMAGQIAAHVTVAYPRELSTVAQAVERVRWAAPLIAPFRLEFGQPFYEGPPRGIGLAVIDREGGWARLRAAILTGSGQHVVLPHVTLVHPRTSDRVAAAWPELRKANLVGSWNVDDVAVTAFDGHRWVAIERVTLGRLG